MVSVRTGGVSDTMAGSSGGAAAGGAGRSGAGGAGVTGLSGTTAGADAATGLVDAAGIVA
jgi:hypothetical protein